MMRLIVLAIVGAVIAAVYLTLYLTMLIGMSMLRDVTFVENLNAANLVQIIFLACGWIIISGENDSTIVFSRAMIGIVAALSYLWLYTAGFSPALLAGLGVISIVCVTVGQILTPLTKIWARGLFGR
jgi:hypothetical protein